ncbi:MAG TPA: MFS transporter [Candidatus Paceibacterota bacterium]|nr:MFS transporter [Candidatus Paceibacterota bacterium]
MKINSVIKTLVMSDFVINSAFGLSAPIFAIFLVDNIQGGNAEVAGFAASVYWIAKSFLQLPIAEFLDKTDGEKDDFVVLVCGQVIASFSLFMYIFATLPWHIYAIEAFLGASMAFAVPAWYGIFTRHIDSGRTSFEWSLESVFSVGVATAISSALGGIIANRYGFNVLFVGAGLWALLGALSLILLYPHLKKSDGKGETFETVEERAKII